MDYKYQLVIQFPSNGMTDDAVDALFELESALEGVDGDFEVDGNDLGSEEMNLFVQTSDPKATLEILRTHIQVTFPWRAAYRDIDGDQFTILHPEGLTTFTVA